MKVLLILMTGLCLVSCKKDDPKPSVPDHFTVKLHAEANEDRMIGYTCYLNNNLFCPKQSQDGYTRQDTSFVFDKGSVITLRVSPRTSPHIAKVKARIEYNNTFAEDSNVVNGQGTYSAATVTITLPK